MVHPFRPCQDMLLPFLIWFIAFASPAGANTDITANALIFPKEEIELSFATPGILKKIHVEDGETVQAGQLLAELEDELEQLESARYEKILEKKRFEYEGSAQLVADRIISNDEALERKLEFDIAQLQDKQAKENLRRKQIVAPLDGVVVAHHGDAGEWVSLGLAVLELVFIDEVFAQLLLPDKIGLTLSKGDPAKVTLPSLDPDKEFEGKIDFIDPRINASSGLMRIRVIIPNPDHIIRPGMRADVRLLPRSGSTNP